jgi:hypothetical protein
MITLTTKLRPGQTPQQAHDHHRPKIATLFQKLRKLYGVIEYACILETHKNGNPHWHVLARCAFIPQKEIQRIWKELTGSWIVGIEKIRHQRKMGKYLTNYVLKEKHVPTEERLGRIVSFSRNYLSPIRVTPSNDEWSWFRDKAPIEIVLASYEGFLKSITIGENGEVLATTEPNERPPNADEIMWAHCNDEPIHVMDGEPWNEDIVIAEVPF